MVMVSIYETNDSGDVVGVEACVNGGGKNLIGQEKRLNFELIREGAAVYYISTFRFDDKEYLNFDISVQCAGDSHDLEWKQQFYRG